MTQHGQSVATPEWGRAWAGAWHNKIEELPAITHIQDKKTFYFFFKDTKRDSSIGLQGHSGINQKI